MWIQAGLCLLVNMFIGFIWYTPYTFLSAVMENKPKKGQKHEMGASHLIGSIVFALMEIFGLYYVVAIMKCKSALEAAKYGYYCWQFFVCPTIGVHYLFNNQPIKQLLVIWGHHLVAFTLEAAIMGYFQSQALTV